MKMCLNCVKGAAHCPRVNSGVNVSRSQVRGEEREREREREREK